MNYFHWVLCLTLFLCVPHMTRAKYDPTWESLDKRPLPDWYDKAKFGIFIHWGVFSVPSYQSEWFWWYWQGDDPQNKTIKFMERNYPPGFTYADFAPQFRAEFYNPDHWADLFKASGAKYVVLTSKHHEGFSLWNSSVSFNWNAMQVGPKKDLVRELANSIRNRTDIHFGLYHSLFEWFNPLYLHDKEADFETRLFPTMKTIPELYEIVNEFEPEIIWSDGDNNANDTYWKSQEFLAWLYNDSPVKDVVVTNDRWGYGVACNHGGYYTCADRYNPGTLQGHKWENCMTIDKSSWGYRREATFNSFLSIHDILTSLVSTVSCGGNLLLNVGPTKEGTIAPIFEERLRQVGQWLKVNGEAIYESVPWIHQNDTLAPHVWYTSKIQTDGSLEVYAIVLKWPEDNLLVLGSPEPTMNTRITMLGYKKPLMWTECKQGGCLIVSFPTVTPTELQSQWVWTLKLTDIDSNKV